MWCAAYRAVCAESGAVVLFGRCSKAYFVSHGSGVRVFRFVATIKLHKINFRVKICLKSLLYIIECS